MEKLLEFLGLHKLRVTIKNEHLSLTFNCIVTTDTYEKLYEAEKLINKTSVCQFNITGKGIKENEEDSL